MACDFSALPKELRLLIAKRLPIDARLALGLRPGRIHVPPCITLQGPHASLVRGLGTLVFGRAPVHARLQCAKWYTCSTRYESWSSYDNVLWTGVRLDNPRR